MESNASQQISRKSVPNGPHALLVDALGGSVAVSKLCGVTHPAVSQWKRSGIPKGWLMFFREKFPEHFGPDGNPLVMDEAGN
ncbi:hypothetical protein ACM9XA_11380 [Xanthomonas sacchari]